MGIWSAADECNGKLCCSNKCLFKNTSKVDLVSHWQRMKKWYPSYWVKLLISSQEQLKMYIPKVSYDISISDHQECQVIKGNQCFGNHLHPHHQDSDVTVHLKIPLHIPTQNSLRQGKQVLDSAHQLLWASTHPWLVFGMYGPTHTPHPLALCSSDWFSPKIHPRKTIIVNIQE
jgi:hypothetical protein